MTLPQSLGLGRNALRGAAVAVLAMGLAACQLVPGAGAIAPDRDPRPGMDGPPPTRMGIARGAVIIAGPRGFCIDRAASQDRAGGAALTVLSACRGLGAGPFGPRPAHPAVLTAAVAAPGPVLPVAAAGPELAAFFASAPGRTALSRSGKAATVSVLESLTTDNALLLHLTDTAPFAWGAVQPDYWRALLMVGGRTVTVSVLTRPDTALSRDDGLALLRDFIAALRAATAEAGLPPAG